MLRVVFQIALYGVLGLAVFVTVLIGVPRWLVVTTAFGVFITMTLLLDHWASQRAGAMSVVRQRRSALAKDIGGLSISLLICAVAVLLLRREWRYSLVALAVFGGVSIWYLDSLVRRLRERSVGPFGPQDWRILRGAVIKLARGRLLAIGLWLTAAGVIGYVTDVSFSWTLRISLLVITATGLVLLGVLPFMGRMHIRFEPPGLSIGALRYQYQIPWDDIQKAGVLKSLHAVGLQLHDAGRIAVAPPSRRASFLARVRSMQRWYGVDVVISAQLFGLQPSVLATAIAVFAKDPSCRPGRSR
jgi:hypothetical protein